MSTNNESSADDRREFPRVAAPMYCRPARRRLLWRRRKVVDVGLGGMRVYSDEGFEVGSRMEIDLMLAEEERFVTCLAEVVWIRELPSHDPAVYDVGLRFLSIPTAARTMIRRLVEAADAAE